MDGDLRDADFWSNELISKHPGVYRQQGPLSGVTRDGDGGWRLVSDNPDYKQLPFPKDGKVLGEVRWAGRTV